MPTSLPTNIASGGTTTGHKSHHDASHAETNTHGIATTGVHGVGASIIESTAGAQAKADAAEAASVARALYDANTVLAATTDNTPVALTVGASTVLGRKATGNIAAMTPTEARAVLAIPEFLGIAVTDETTTLTTGVAKVTFRMPFAMTLSAVRSNLNTVSSSGLVTVDINEGGTTILSTKLSIDASEKTSVTAATAAVISDASLADDAEITVDIDAAGTGAKGLKIWLLGIRT